MEKGKTKDEVKRFGIFASLREVELGQQGIARMAKPISSTRSWTGNRSTTSRSLEQRLGGEIKFIQTRRPRETPTGTKIIIHERKPDIPITDEFTKSIVGAYNQVAAGMIKRLERDFNSDDQRLEGDR